MVLLVPIEERAGNRRMLVVSRTRAEDLLTVTRYAWRKLGGSRPASCKAAVIRTWFSAANIFENTALVQ
jgi:hypothetical protein